MANALAAAFTGNLPVFYDTYLVPMQFMPYANFIAERAREFGPLRILETAAGTGIVTQALASKFPVSAITATDLNDDMLAQARKRPGLEGVTWRQADAQALPFSDETFDLMVCQFGVMFYPDKLASFREARRVLKPKGTYLFVVWDDYHAMSHSPMWIAAQTVGHMIGRDPSTLLSPGYYEEPVIRADLAAAGFSSVAIERVARPSRASSARDAATIMVQGSLLRAAIEAWDATRLDEATDAVEQAMRARFGEGPINGETKALMVTASKVS
jgi:SAM-dependent methyltransferase